MQTQTQIPLAGIPIFSARRRRDGFLRRTRAGTGTDERALDRNLIYPYTQCLKCRSTRLAPTTPEMKTIAIDKSQPVQGPRRLPVTVRGSRSALPRSAHDAAEGGGGGTVSVSGAGSRMYRYRYRQRRVASRRRC
ncbi:hypothetical protein EVG20_g11371 [Dentipellis fragilis]|uniref:Uncharacterized protein n=1 Tax=Dentipellis fragilis TaxID=205917 RepID=A0A4Y9XND0_9AGAM|nr:hypothetical protein EVG20_g11371 [Dentipellis fragilis]